MFRALRSEDLLGSAECPCCGFRGKFKSAGTPVRVGALCPTCGSLERHRLFNLVHSQGNLNFANADVLHFAPEKFNAALIRMDDPGSYASADILPGRADLILDLEAIDRPDESCDVVVCSHVLEHVDDRLAIRELYRILRPGGRLVAMIPIIEGWSATYENGAVDSDVERLRHFGLESHLRFYGADFRDRLRSVGFEVVEFGANGAESVRFGLQRGEKVFVANKPHIS